MSVEQRVRVLLIEDSRTDAAMVRGMFQAVERPQFHLQHELCLDHGIHALRQNRFDLILLDLTLPDSAGLASFIRLYRHASHLPIVILTSIDDEATALEALRRGAQDYLVKGCIEVRLLLRTILYALERKRREQQLKDLQQQLATLSDDQQQRVAQQLHDGLGQHLTGVALMAKTLERRLAAQSSPLAAEAGELTSLVVEAQHQLRDLVKGLHPVDVDRRGLSAALTQLAHETEHCCQIHCRFDQQGDAVVEDYHVATHLYYIAREAVANAVKHSEANQIVVRLRQLQRGLTLQVEDDGKGFVEAAMPGGGMGLRIMRNRAEAIGAWINVEATSPHGTSVTCNLPEHEEAENACEA